MPYFFLWLSLYVLGSCSTINLSIAIVLGVAPLLFIQVIYDPFWYTANAISVWWAMAFLLVITLGFLSLYVFYLKRNKNPAGFGIFSLVMVVFAGVSMFAMQQLLPEKWLSWYVVNGSLQPWVAVFMLLASEDLFIL